MARVTEKLRVHIEHCTLTSPFYVGWVNNLGGVDFFMFSKAQAWGGNVNRGNEYEPYFQSLSVATATRRNLTTTTARRVQVYAEQITTQQVIGLESLLQSGRVYWLSDLATTNGRRLYPCKTVTTYMRLTGYCTPLPLISSYPAPIYSPIETSKHKYQPWRLHGSYVRNAGQCL